MPRPRSVWVSSSWHELGKSNGGPAGWPSATPSSKNRPGPRLAGQRGRARFHQRPVLVEPRQDLAISEFPKWRKYLILLSFLDNSSARPVQIGGVDVNICHSRSTAVRGRRRSSSQSPPRGPFCRTRTGPVEADGAVDAQNAPTAPWKTLCVFHELPQGLSHQVTHEKLRKAPKYRWETRIDPKILRTLDGNARFGELLSRVRTAWEQFEP